MTHYTPHQVAFEQTCIHAFPLARHTWGHRFVPDADRYIDEGGRHERREEGPTSVGKGSLSLISRTDVLWGGFRRLNFTPTIVCVLHVRGCMKSNANSPTCIHRIYILLIFEFNFPSNHITSRLHQVQQNSAHKINF